MGKQPLVKLLQTGKFSVLGLPSEKDYAPVVVTKSEPKKQQQGKQQQAPPQGGKKDNKKQKKEEKAKEEDSPVPPPAPKEKEATTTVAKKKEPYDRWSLINEDETPIEYGYLGKTGGTGVGGDNSYYITTAINYTNGPAHMGHAYEGTTSDVIARYRRSLGDHDAVYFVTGADEHGQKIANTAENEQKQPQDICDKYANGFRCLNQRTLISNDDYIRTTSDRHKRNAKELWKRCSDDIYLDTYKGWYNEREENFVTDLEAQQSDYKDPTSGLPLKRVEESSYFFKMSEYKDRLIEYIETTNPTFIQPQQHKNQILSRLKSDDLRDLSISRTTFSWGIPAPDGFDANHVMYVWVDALSNYLTGVNALNVNDDGNAVANLDKFWPANVHIIGKDILWFHTVIWPCLLMSAKLPLPQTVYAHGFVNDKEGKKMSKSMGNVIDPHDMLDKFHVDTFRWYLCKEAPYGGELAFNEDSMRDMHNADLCDTIGNLVHRATTLCQKYCKGVVPSNYGDMPSGGDKYPLSDPVQTIKSYIDKMSGFELQGGANIAIQGFRDTNKYLDDEAPWLKKGNDDETVLARQITVINTLEAIYVLSHLLLPFLSTGGTTIFRQKLQTKPRTLRKLLDSLAQPKRCLLTAGTKITIGDVLYDKVLSEEEMNNAKEASKKKQESYLEAQKRKKEAKAKQIAASKQGKKNADVDQPEFTKLDIRVGKIVKVWNHESADKLFCEQIDVGEKDIREIASGLRGHYTLEEMQDKKVLVVCNLKAAKLAGFSSNGMVLAAKGGDNQVELVSPPEDAPIGERVFLEGMASADQFEPVTSAQVKKRKVFEAVSKDLKTLPDSTTASWKGQTVVTSKGPCFAKTLQNAPIA